MQRELGTKLSHISRLCQRPRFWSTTWFHSFALGKSIFNIHDPLATKYLYQIRLGLSPLHNHKNNHNFKDTPSSACFCGTGIEDTSHFLFRCPLHASHRAVLATKVIEVLTKNNLTHLRNDVSVYLYGHYSLKDEDNRSIILATLDFLKNTDRFT